MNYMKNVYHIENGTNKLTNGRVSPKYKTPQVIMPLLLGFIIRIEGMNDLKFRLLENESSMLWNFKGIMCYATNITLKSIYI